MTTVEEDLEETVVAVPRWARRWTRRIQYSVSSSNWWPRSETANRKR